VPVFAVTPSDKYSALPASLGLTHRTVSFESTRDRAALTGWWFEGKKDQPVIVLFGRGQGSMGDLLPVVSGFAAQGFQVMTFDYRDFGPGGPGAADSLVQLAFASRWVNDGEGALRYAREQAHGQPVFAWGQDLGSACVLAAAARARTNADAIAIEGVFRTLNELLRMSGLSQVSGAPERHRFLVETSDEPVTAISGLMVPMHIVIAQQDQVWPAAITQEVTRRSLSRIDRWILPDAGHEGVEKRPDYFERVGGWYKRIAGMIKASAPAPAEAAK
jgi:alpha-beta hydrolase superfamily lysophospholipase